MHNSEKTKIIRENTRNQNFLGVCTYLNSARKNSNKENHLFLLVSERKLQQ